MDLMETNMNVLPDEILCDILVRLRVKHLLQSKCVCKHWHALIRDSAFITRHYQFQHANHLAVHNDLPLLLDQLPDLFRPLDKKTAFYILSRNQGDNVLLNITPNLERDITPTLATDSKLDNMEIHCIGIVNGVVGLQWGHNNQWGHNHLALWNPATREFKDVPRWRPSNVIGRYPTYRIIGFGYDIQSNDFKILGLIAYDGSKGDERLINKCACDMYSLRTNSWKSVKTGFTSTLYIERSSIDACLNNGVYYWLAHDNVDHGFYGGVCFNFSTEIFKEYELPKSYGCRCDRREILDNGVPYCECKYPCEIGKYKEGLALFVTRHIPTNTTSEEEAWSFEIWQVTSFEHEIPSSWQHLITVGPIQILDYVWFNTFRVCGDLLVRLVNRNYEEESKGYIYDPSTHTWDNLGITCSSSFTYFESLFSLCTTVPA